MSDIRKTLKLKDDLRHKDVVALEDAIYRQPNRLLMLSAANSSRTADVLTRAAIEAGWITEPKTESGKFGEETRHFVDGVNVDDMEAWQVLHIGSSVERLHKSITDAPKN
jgi:hypothetical protein